MENNSVAEGGDEMTALEIKTAGRYTATHESGNTVVSIEVDVVLSSGRLVIQDDSDMPVTELSSVCKTVQFEKVAE